MFQEVTDTPTALASIDTGTRYTVVNRTRLPVKLKVSAIAPGQNNGPDIEDYLPIAGSVPGINPTLYPQADDGESIWIWTDSGSGEVAYEPATS